MEANNAEEREGYQGEQLTEESINTDDLRSTADLLDQHERTKTFVINRNNSWQQLSPYKKLFFLQQFLKMTSLKANVPVGEPAHAA